MLKSAAARFVIPAGVAVIVMRPGETPRVEMLAAPMGFDRRPAVCGQWLEFTTDISGSVRVQSGRVRTVTMERNRVDAHGWRDGDE